MSVEGMPTYLILSNASIYELQMSVRKAISDNYEPVGGVSMGPDHRFYQAVRYAPAIDWSEMDLKP